MYFSNFLVLFLAGIANFIVLSEFVWTKFAVFWAEIFCPHVLPFEINFCSFSEFSIVPFSRNPWKTGPKTEIVETLLSFSWFPQFWRFLAQKKRRRKISHIVVVPMAQSTEVDFWVGFLFHGKRHDRVLNRMALYARSKTVRCLTSPRTDSSEDRGRFASRGKLFAW